MQSFSTNDPDEVILSLLLDNNPLKVEKGMRLMMDTYQERLYRLIRRMVLDHEDTNDVLQNCFIKAYRNISSFRKKSKLYTWLYKIASNEAITFINRRDRKKTISLDEQANQVTDKIPADVFFNGEEVRLLLVRAIEQLPQKQKLIFTLRYYEELTYEEMSEILGTTTGGLKASYHHAVKKIEQFLKEKEII